MTGCLGNISVAMEQDIGTPAQGTVPVAKLPWPSWHQLISARGRASADPGAMATMGNSTQYYARVRGLVFEFKNARDLNDVTNRHLRLFLDQIGCDDQMTLTIQRSAEGRFLQCHGIHHVVAVRFANFRACLLTHHGFKLAGSRS